MIIHNDPLLYLFFGDARTSFDNEFLRGNCSQEELFEHPQLARLRKTGHLDSLVLLRQMHSSEGVVVTDENLQGLLTHKSEGDFLITQIEHAGLTVYAADCLPIIFYDTYNRVLSICHAGWKGSVERIAERTLERMQKEYKTKLDHIRIFFGPSARVCCYSVSQDFRKHFEPFTFADQVFVNHRDELFVDMPLFNRLQLEEYGVKKDAFHCRYNICTICNLSFCSYRRGDTQRQLTVAVLK